MPSPQPNRPTDTAPTLPPASRLPAAAALHLPPELAAHPRYRILRELGRGGMGVVYQAQQTVMNRQVAIKVINRALLDHPNAVERFRREVEAAARLSHPNIVTAFDAEQAGDLHMLIMEFVPGQNLAHVLKRGPLPVAHACHYVRQAALGLQHAHEQRMVHRDIKPQNLMLTPKGQVKILDFGLAKLASEHGQSKGLTASGAYMGTPDYSAPEQATDARSADIRADIYSLGCTLHCLLAGRPPFQEGTAVLTILAHLGKEPTPLPELRPDVPPALWQVVTRLLAKDPARRYQEPAEVAQALLPFVKPGQKGPPPAPTPAPRAESSTASPFEGIGDTLLPPRKKEPPAPAGSWRKRWPLLTGAAGLLALGGVLGLVLLAVPSHRPVDTGEQVRTAPTHHADVPRPKPLDCTRADGVSAAEMRQAQEAWAKYLGREVEETVEIGDGVKMTFVLVPPGKFRMGSPADEKERSDDEILHE